MIAFLPRLDVAAFLRRLFGPSLAPVVAYPVPCEVCRGERYYETTTGPWSTGERECSNCRDPWGYATGISGHDLRRNGVLIGSLRSSDVDSEEADELAVRLSRMSDEQAIAFVDREVR